MPHSTADQIADDFATYSNGNESVSEQVLYKYQRVTDEGQGEEVFLPLDFDEVQSLSVVMDDRTREIHASDV